jgi:hypothetical protein
VDGEVDEDARNEPDRPQEEDGGIRGISHLRTIFLESNTQLEAAEEPPDLPTPI